jgi:hypothetical protein
MFKTGDFAKGCVVRLRQARLKPKFWSLYPTIPSGVWHGAAALVGLVLRNQRGRPTFASLVDRPLPAEHFDFRAGDPPRQRQEIGSLTRCHDRALLGAHSAAVER